MAIKNTIRLILFVLACGLMLAACDKRGMQEESKDVAEDKNDEKFDTKANEKDAQFVVDAVSDSYAEIELSELAETRAVDDEVKKVAADLKSSYTVLLEKLKVYATAKAISIPTAEAETTRNKMEKLAADKKFDKGWSDEVRDISKNTIDRFESASESLTDQELKTLASNSLTEIRKNHDKIMSCNNRLK